MALALPIAGSRFAVSLPFAMSFAWTAVTLAASAGLLRATSTRARLGWTAALAVAWTQLATAHISNGLASGSLIVAAYWVFRLAADVRRGRRSLRQAASLTGFAVAAVLAVAAGALVPRLLAAGDTMLAGGFGDLQGSSGALGLFGRGLNPGWVFRLALSPGASVGLVIPALAGAALWSRRRSLVWGVGAFAGISYVLSLDATARWVEATLGRSGAVGWYLHLPERFGFGLLVAFAILAAIGLETALGADGVRRRAWMLAPGAAVWAAGAVLVGGSAWALLIPVAGAIGGGAVALRGRTPRWGLTMVLAAELGLAGILMTSGVSTRGRSEPLLELPIAPVDLAGYVRPGPIARAMAMDPAARYLSLDAGGWTERGTYNRQDPEAMGFMGTHRASLFELQEAQGFDPFQLRGPWLFSRAVDPRPLIYNATSFRRPPDRVFDLFRVGWVISPADEGSAVALGPLVAREGPWVLRRVRDIAPPASVVGEWTVTPDQEAAVRAAAGPGFDPRTQAILERSPGVTPGPVTGTASVMRPGPESVRVTVRTGRPSVVVLREAWDRRWTAAVDGRPTPVLRADGFLLAVAVPGGDHTIRLQHDDPALLLGLLWSVAVLTALLAGARMGRPSAGQDAGHRPGDHGQAQDDGG
jgi:hypothetical protein